MFRDSLETRHVSRDSITDTKYRILSVILSRLNNVPDNTQVTYEPSDVKSSKLDRHVVDDVRDKRLSGKVVEMRN